MEAILVILVIVLIVVLVRHNGALSRLSSQMVALQARVAELETTRPVLGESSRSAPATEALPTSTERSESPDSPPLAEVGPATVPEPATPEMAIAAAETSEPIAPISSAWPASRSPSPPATPPARFDWERFIGLRLPIWLGAIALCVAGYFFVSYAIESGFFTPEMRVLAAATAALAFLAGAEFVRRRVTTGNPAAIASALGAAAIATAYATAFLATRVYDLVPTGIGFVATIAVSALAIAIALAYGQVVALVGMLGAYVAPIVYGGGEPNAPFLMIYVTAITAASYAVIARKSWWRLSVMGLLGPGLWGLIWAVTPALLAESFWSDAFVIGLPAIVAIASWRGWRDDGEIIGLRGLTGAPTPQRLSLVAAVLMAAIGFVLFLAASWSHLFGGHGATIGLWQGLIAYGALLVALGFVSASHRALQLPVLIATLLGLLLWPSPDPVAATVVIVASAIIFGFGALDQFRRLREPALWAWVLAAMALILFGLGLFKIDGWQSATDHKHLWALGALALAAGFVALLRVFGPKVADELQRSATYAAWGGAVTTLVSLAVVLEIDPLYFPAASAVAILGLAAVHLRVPVRGLRIIAAVYLVLYGLLLLGAFGYVDSVPPFFPFVFAPDIVHHALVLLVLPGLALLLAATLFQRKDASTRFVGVFDVVGMVVLALGLVYLISPSRTLWAWGDMYTIGGLVVSAELALALVGIYLGRRLGRDAASVAGLVLAGLTSLAVLGLFLLPLLAFWPAFVVPGVPVFNMALVALGVPAALLFAMGWLARQDSRQSFRALGMALSVFAVVVTYALLIVEIRQAWHASSPTLQGDMPQSEFYAYSAATLVYGLLLLGGGFVFQHRGARALSFIFVLAATLKVFLIDAAELQGLWRVLSFLLMGLAFLGISWAYARFVFGIGVRRPAAEPPPPPAA